MMTDGICATTRVVIAVGILACLDGYMNIAMEQTEVGDDDAMVMRAT